MLQKKIIEKSWAWPNSRHYVAIPNICWHDCLKASDDLYKLSQSYCAEHSIGRGNEFGIVRQMEQALLENLSHCLDVKSEINVTNWIQKFTGAYGNVHLKQLQGPLWLFCLFEGLFQIYMSSYLIKMNIDQEMEGSVQEQKNGPFGLVDGQMDLVSKVIDTLQFGCQRRCSVRPLLILGPYSCLSYFFPLLLLLASH